LFTRAFDSKNSLTGTGTGHSRSGTGSAFKLSSNPKHAGAKRLPDDSNLSVDEVQPKGSDDESNNSQRGIWHTREFTIEIDEERNLDEVKDYRAV
jgi:hypothetical protein